MCPGGVLVACQWIEVSGLMLAHCWIQGFAYGSLLWGCRLTARSLGTLFPLVLSLKSAGPGSLGAGFVWLVLVQLSGGMSL